MSKMNKWFYAFLAASVLFVGAIVTVLIIALGGNNTPPEPEQPSEGAETGVYYYDAEKGEYTLSLNSGNKFTITGPDLNKSGEYAVNGSEISLDFVKDEDGTATVTVADNVLTMLWNNAEMRFLKKIDFTVTFQTSGGSEVANATVRNGKTVAMPADPTKDGNAFIGWYADEACTKAFDFNTTVISADTTVYARWIVLQAGKSEYTVNFDLGYDEAGSVSVETTVNSAIHVLPEPKREGYTFAGWWVSAYEDGEKLTYAYTEGTELNADTTLYAMWIDDASQKLPAPGVSVSGTAIKWESVNGATTYQVIITNANGEEILKKNVGATQESFDFSAQAAGDYTVSVVAVANDATKNSDPAIRYYRNKALDRVSGYSVIDGVLVTWNPVAGAQKYLVTVDCGNDSHTHTALANGRNTFFSIANCPMQKGGITVTVVAVADGYVDSVPSTFTYEKSLSAVSGIVYNEETFSFEWARVENAVKYYVLLTCEGHTHALVDNGSSTSYSVKYCTGALSIEVYPVTAGYNSPDATKVEYTKTTLPAPTNVALNGKTLTWDTVEGATSYQVKIGGKVVSVDTNTYNLDDAGITFVGGEAYEVSVMAVGATNSAYSDVVVAKAFVLSNVAYYNNTLTWDPVIGVNNYEVTVNGGAVITVTNATSVKVTLTKAGINTIGVKYAGSSEWVNVEVYAYELVYDSRSISGVAKEYLAIGDAMSMPTTFVLDGYDFAGWYNAPGGSAGNGVPYPHAVFSENADTVLYANWTPKQYNIIFFGCDSIDGINTGDTLAVTYTKDFKLPVPVGDDTSDFFGWVTTSGEPVTDAQGNSLKPYSVTRDTAVTPFFDTGVVTYSLRSDGTYAASKGPGIGTVETVTIRETYKGVRVTAILENGFYDCDNLKYINIPDTIELIGTGAFNSCNILEGINVYEVETQTPHEVVYFSDDGALLFYDKASDLTYLEIFPRGKDGHYKMSEQVDVIRNLAFDTVDLASIEISNNVSLIVKNAFYNCRYLQSVTFAPKGTTPLVLEAGAFNRCTAMKVLVLPARMNAFESMRDLDVLTKLETIDIEEGNANYSAVDGMLCDALGQTILYCPAGYAGDNGVFSFAVSIRTIASDVFAGNSNIKEVVIPASMDAIESKAFFRCNSIEKITFAGNRAKPLTIGDQAFAECLGLSEVNFGTADSKATTLNTGAITLGTKVFACNANAVGKLKTVNVYAGANIAKLGVSTFENNPDLTKLNVADVAAITAIDSRAFANTGFSKFELHHSTETVGAQAFADSQYLATFVFSANEDLTFGAYAFQNCVRLSEVVLPAEVTKFDPSALDGCTSIKQITVEAGSKSFVADEYGILYTTGFSEIIFYPSSLDGDLTKLPWDKLTTIGANVFKNNKNITTVTIGANVTEIGNAAFEGCTNLTEVKFAGESYTKLSIGASAFSGCTKLTTVDLTKGVKTVGTAAFKGCTELTTVVLPDTLTVIADSMFENCSKLATVNMPTSLTVIGSKAFVSTAITSVTIPNTVTTIGDAAFRNAKQLATLIFAPGGDAPLTIGTAATTQGVFASAGLTGVVELPERLTVLGGYTFAGCSKLTEVKFAANSKVTAINNYTFQSSGITKIDLTGIKTIGNYAFASCSKLTSVTIPTGVTSIGNNAFAGSAVATITLPGTLETIGNYAFQNTKFASVTIPISVTSIGQYSFSSSYLTSVNFELGGTEALTIGSNAFANTKFATITLPARLVDLGGSGTNSPNTQTSYHVYFAYRVFNNNTTLTEILVEEGKDGAITTYGSYDGILYLNMDQESEKITPYATLLYCPLGKTGTAYIAKEVTYVETLAFKASKLTNIIFEDFDSNDPRYGVPTLVIGRGLAATKRSDAVFSGANIAKIQFPSHLKRLNNYALGKGSSTGALTKNGVEIVFHEKSLVEFGPYAFAQNTAITALTLPKVATIERNAFQGATKLASVSMAEGSTVQYILTQAFRGCSALTSIVIPDSVKEIENIVFDGCSKLSSITWQNGCPNLITIGNQAFMNTAFTSFKIPDAVQWVGDGVWSNCSKMTSIEVSKSMITGYSSANTGLFTGCTALKEIIVPDGHAFLSNGKNADGTKDGILYDVAGTILYCYPQAKIPADNKFVVPDTVITIHFSAFYNFKGTELVLSKNLEEIKNSAFQSARSLTAIEIPAKVHTMGNSAFSGCNALTQITFAKGSQLTAIGSSAFSGCSAIVSISLPDNVAAIGMNAFQGCYRLETVVLPKALEKIEGQTFWECTALKDITIQEGVTEIANLAFARTAIAEITLPDSLVTLGTNVFQECDNLTTVILSENASLETIGDKAFAGNAKLKNVGLGGKLKTIGVQAFADCTALESVVIPASATTIGKEAFKGCTSLTTAEMPGSLEAIPAGLFENCTSLTEIVIGPAVTEIGAAAFKNCTALTTVTFDAACGITSIGTEVFANTTSLSAIALPSTVTKIETRAFYQSGLSELSLPLTLNSMGTEAFRGCVNLEAVTIPNALTIIPAYAFAECTSLTTLNMYAGLERINDFAFSGCSSLTEVVIPATVERLGQNPFMNCASITKFELNENTSFTLHEGVLYDQTMYTLLYYPASKTDETFVLPAGTKEIAGGAFSASKLKKIVLHEGVTVIPESAFENCAQLTEVVMANITSIGNSAFKNCTALTTIEIPASVKDIGDYVFAGCSALTNEGFTLAEGSKLEEYGTHLFEGATSITAPFSFFRTFMDYMYANTGITTLTFDGSENLSAVGIFANCAKLTSISWTNSPSQLILGQGVFMGCTALESVVLPEGLSDLGTYAREISEIERNGAYGVFAGCTALKSVTLPSTLNYVGACTFEDCVSLTTVKVNEGGRGFSVYARAFKNCVSFNDAAFFPNVSYIAEEAFMNCVSLEGEIHVSEKFEEFAGNCFNGCEKITAVYLPARMGAVYKESFAGMSKNVIFYVAMDQREFEGMIGKENPFEGYQVEFIGGGKEDGKKEEEKK